MKDSGVWVVALRMRRDASMETMPAILYQLISYKRIPFVLEYMVFKASFNCVIIIESL